MSAFAPISGEIDVSAIADAHVAAATIAHADGIVSWNFRHIVRLDKIKALIQERHASR